MQKMIFKEQEQKIENIRKYIVEIKRLLTPFVIQSNNSSKIRFNNLKSDYINNSTLGKIKYDYFTNTLEESLKDKTFCKIIKTKYNIFFIFEIDESIRCILKYIRCNKNGIQYIKKQSFNETIQCNKQFFNLIHNLEYIPDKTDLFYDKNKKNIYGIIGHYYCKYSENEECYLIIPNDKNLPYFIDEFNMADYNEEGYNSGNQNKETNYEYNDPLIKK